MENEPSRAPGLERRRAEVRRERLLDAAERLFSRSGFRATTMEGLAAEAGVAKATVYAYYPDKESAFRAVAERLAAQIGDIAETNIRAAPDFETGVIEALLAKESLVYRVAHASPYAHELIESGNRLAAAAFAEAERRKLAALTIAMTGMRMQAPAEAARLLAQAAEGIAAAAKSAEALAEDLTHMLKAFLRGWPRRP